MSEQENKQPVPFDPAKQHSAVHMDLRIQQDRVYDSSDPSKPIEGIPAYNRTRELVLALLKLNKGQNEIKVSFPPGIQYILTISTKDHTFERGNRGGD